MKTCPYKETRNSPRCNKPVTGTRLKWKGLKKKRQYCEKHLDLVLSRKEEVRLKNEKRS